MKSMASTLKTAIVHDWILDIGGSEACLEQIYRLYPSDVFALLKKNKSVQRLGIDTSRVRSSFLQSYPRSTKSYRWYLPLFPYAVEQLDVSGYDVVISSSHAVAKGVLTNAQQLHICYCHTPSRYAWDLFHLYRKEAGLSKGALGHLAALMLHYLRIWDAASAQRVDRFIANSRFVACRIRKVYGREAAVIYPPVDVKRFSVSDQKEDYYLAVSRMVPYKRMNLIVEAFSRMPDRKLIVIGDGPGYKEISASAPKNVEVHKPVPFETLRIYLQRARALVFAAEEDFGITPVEAQACGTPVIAYGRGGCEETVVPLNKAGEYGNESEGHPTGVFFHEQTADALVSAVKFFELHEPEFDAKNIRQHSLQFSTERFQRQFKEFVENAVYEHFSRHFPEDRSRARLERAGCKLTIGSRCIDGRSG